MGIKEIRILKELRPDEYRELAEEYLSTRLQDFCYKHSIGKTAAVEEF